MSAMVYVMKGWGQPEWFKIGCTGNLAHRLGPGREHVVCQIPATNMYLMEWSLHQVFRERRINPLKEAFALTESDLTLLNEIATCSDPDAKVQQLLAGHPRVYSNHCLRCEQDWDARVDNPKYCPRCKSPYWNKPRKRRI